MYSNILYPTIISTVAFYSSSFVLKCAMDSVANVVMTKTIDVISKKTISKKIDIEYEYINDNILDEKILVNSKDNSEDWVFIDEDNMEYNIFTKVYETPSYKPIRSLKIKKGDMDTNNFILEKINTKKIMRYNSN